MEGYNTLAAHYTNVLMYINFVYVYIRYSESFEAIFIQICRHSYSSIQYHISIGSSSQQLG